MLHIHVCCFKLDSLYSLMLQYEAIKVCSLIELSSDVSFDHCIVACGKQGRFNIPNDIQMHVMHLTVSAARMVVGNILTGDLPFLAVFDALDAIVCLQLVFSLRVTWMPGLRLLFTHRERRRAV